MQNYISHLFRLTPDMDKGWLTHWGDWAVAISFISLLHMFVTHYEDMKNKKQLRRVLSLILPVFLLFRFGILRGYYTAAEQWPLYSCNLAAIILAAGYLQTPKRTAGRDVLNWGIFAGAYGGPLAVVLANPGRFALPHVTHIDYYIGHVAITFAGWMLILAREEPYSVRDLKMTSLITVGYLGLCRIVNPLIEGNFGFIMGPPEAVGFLHALPLPVYQILVMTGFLLANALIWHLANRQISRKVGTEFASEHVNA